MRKETVILKAKDSGANQSFDVAQANRLIKMNNSQWSLDDKNWTWNGLELAKAKAKETEKN